MRLEDLPPHLRAQAEKQLSDAPKMPWGLRQNTRPIGREQAPCVKGGKNAPSRPPFSNRLLVSPEAQKRATGGNPRQSKRMTRADAKIDTVTLAHTTENRLVCASVDISVNPRLLPTAQQKGVDFKTRRFYTKGKVKAWEKVFMKVFTDFQAHLSGRKWCDPLQNGVFVNLTFAFPHNKGTAKAIASQIVPHTVRPDCDNLAKGLLDAFVNAHAISDDALISMLTVTKIRSPKPMVTLLFGPITSAAQCQQLPRITHLFGEGCPVTSIQTYPIDESDPSIPF